MAWIVGIGIFLFLLFMFPKPVLSLLAAIGVIAGVLISNNYWEQYKTDQKKAKIRIVINSETEKCDEKYPLSIFIQNLSDTTLNKVEFTLVGYRTGYSDPIYKSDYIGYKIDKIIKGQTGWKNCWVVPKLADGVSKELAEFSPPKKTIWKAENVSIDFAETE